MPNLLFVGDVRWCVFLPALPPAFSGHWRVPALAVACAEQRPSCPPRRQRVGRGASLFGCRGTARGARSQRRRAAKRSASAAPTRTRTARSRPTNCSAARRKAFAKLDVNGNGALSFEEWAAKTIDKFKGADADHNGWLTAAEYATTAPPPPKHKTLQLRARVELRRRRRTTVATTIRPVRRPSAVRATAASAARARSV